jgi:two-component system, NarL family, nitrate/nitrite response regulator NarL
MRRDRVLVLGPAGIERELAELMLTEAGWALHRYATDPDVAVVVLVSPTAETWTEAEGHARPVVVLHPIGRADARAVLDALRRGAVALVDAESSREDFQASLDAASRGDVRLSVRQAGELVAVVGDVAGDRVVLTRRESEILASIRAGHSVKQTARHLGITVKTVENIQRRLLRKLGARNRADALMRAHRLGVLADADGPPSLPGAAAS